ncbi:hypothetical protein pVco7_gp049 [Vibrio phage pVco-7]|uniref:Uncharacterized protein n=1 Tax=Vibrio phage pVco-5 TaxID=1965485 RepID=A0A1W6JUT9_9CAUD|nr:hypothetical protein KNT61_gp050 [Vibrio phage pVco-5]ARM71038.1 hypothetical protein pVco5_050 [Vibrio phage pVco-5]
MMLLATYNHTLYERQGKVYPIFTYDMPYTLEKMYGSYGIANLSLSRDFIARDIKYGRMLRITRGTTI